MVQNILSTLLFVLLALFFQKASSQTQASNFSTQVEELYNSGKHEDVLAYCKSIEKESQLLNSSDSLEYARVCHLKAKSLFELSEYNKSIETLYLAKKYTKNHDDAEEVLSGIYYYLHINYGVQLKLFECIKYGDLAINTLQVSENPNYDLLLKLYGRMAVYLSQAGEYVKAYNFMQKGEDLLDNLPPHTQLLSPKVSYRVKLLYRKILVGFINQVLKSAPDSDPQTLHVDKMIEKDKASLDSLFLYNNRVVKNGDNKFQYDNDTYYYALALNFYAYYYASKKQPIADINLLHREIDKAIELLQKKYYRRHLYQFKSTKAKLYQIQKQHEKALAIFDEIIDNTTDANNNKSNFYIYKGLVLFETNHIQEGKKIIHKALNVIHSGSEPLLQDFSNFQPGHKFNDIISLSNLTTNISLLKYNFKDKEDYIATLNDLAFKQFIGTYKDQSLNKNTDRFLKLILKRLVENKAMSNDYLSKVEDIQNHFAWKQFNQNRNVVQLPVVDSLENIEYELRKQLATAKRKRNIRAKDSILTRLEVHQDNMKKYYPKVFDFSQGNFSLDEFQHFIASGEVVLKYLFFDDQFAVIQITKNEVTYQLKPFNDEEKKLLDIHLEQIRNQKRGINYNNDLTELLIPKSVLSNYKRIVVIPDNPLYQLPFETLTYNNKFLLEDKIIRYSSHLRFSFFNKEVDDSGGVNVSIFAPEYTEGKSKLATRSSNYFLEGAQKEAKMINTLFDSDYYIGEFATKSNFVSNKSRADIIHLAMHATIDQKNPELSHFNFTNNEKLFIEELYGLKIPAELAVLSACNTAVGYASENTVGLKTLQHAFSYAGTKASVASIWEVPDNATSHIMIDFYKNLKNGETKSEALRYAKLNYIKNTKIEKLKHPYYWAGFVLYGEDSPIVDSVNYLKYGLIFIGILIVIYLFRIYRRKRVV